MTDNICGADMGEGVTCQEQLVAFNATYADAGGWRCAAGHVWRQTVAMDRPNRTRWRRLEGHPDERLPMATPTPLHATPVPDELATVPTEDGYELVMPFVCCSSNGGPFDDDAFVAGVQFGALNHRLRQHPRGEIREYVTPALVPQLDLLAMHHGYTLTAEPWDEHPDAWALAIFRVSPADERAA